MPLTFNLNLPITPQTGNGLSFQILCGGDGFTKVSDNSYAYRGVPQQL